MANINNPFAIFRFLSDSLDAATFRRLLSKVWKDGYESGYEDGKEGKEEEGYLNPFDRE